MAKASRKNEEIKQETEPLKSPGSYVLAGIPLSRHYHVGHGDWIPTSTAVHAGKIVRILQAQ